MPGLNEAEVRVVEVPRHDFNGEKPITQARIWAKQHIVGGYTLTDNSGAKMPYAISAQMINKYLSASAVGKSENMGVHLSVLKELPTVISNSIEVEVHPDYKKDDYGKRVLGTGINENNLIHRFYGAVSIDGVVYRVKTTIIESKADEKKKPHSFEVSNVELIEETAGQDGREGSDTHHPRYSETSSEKDISGNAETIPATNLLQGVEKSYDNGVKILEKSEPRNENVIEEPSMPLSRGKQNVDDAPVRLHTAMSRSKADFDAIRDLAVAERGIVMPGLNEAEVQVVDVPRHDFKGSGKEALKAAEKWAKENIVGIHQAKSSDDEIFDYSISNEAVEKYLSKSATGKSDNIGIHIAALKMLPEIIGSSIETEIHADYKKSDGVRNSNNTVNPKTLIHRFYGAISTDGKIHRVKTTIREYRDINYSPLAYSYEITQIELLKAPSDDAVSNIGEHLAMTSNSSISVAKLLDGVEKSYDYGVKVLENASLYFNRLRISYHFGLLSPKQTTYTFSTGRLMYNYN